MDWRRPAIAFLAGAGSVLAYAPFELFPLAALALGVLFWLLNDAGRPRAGFALGFAWGLGAMLAGVSWLYVALHRFGGMEMPLAALAILLFCAFFALFAGLAGGLFASLRRGQALPDALLFAAAWGFGEWLRGWAFTGFPWLASGYSQTPPSPLAGFAPVFGVYGVGALLAFVAASMAGALGWRLWRPAVLALAILSLGAGLRLVSWTWPTGEPVKVALLQTNVEQGLKWRPELLERWLAMNLQMLRDNPATLVVMPETTLPLLVEQLPEGYLDALARNARAGGGDVILGTFTRDAAGHIYNAAISLGRSPPQHYAKQHLVPFGEYSPPLFHWFYDLAQIPMADQTGGSASQAPMQIGGQKVAVNICYEDVFGEELIRALPDATLMLNLSNLAWYGDSLAQPQHLQIARLRALESGRPMLRATNTGMTAVVAPDGAVRAVLPPFSAGALHAELRGYAGLTPYARWGNWPLAGAASAILALSWLGLRRREDALLPSA